MTAITFPDTDKYSTMLQRQLELTFPLERSFFNTPLWETAQKVLEVGCGDGCYLKRLMEEFPRKEYTGVEHDPGLAERATQVLGNTVTIHASSLEEKAADLEKYDAVIIRLVVNQVRDRDAFFTALSKLLHEKSILFIMDADDRFFHVKPEPKEFLTALGCFRKEVSTEGATRSLRERLPGELEGYGLSCLSDEEYVVNSAESGNKGVWLAYMKATARLAKETLNLDSIDQELEQWSENPRGEAQFALFVQKYQGVM